MLRTLDKKFLASSTKKTPYIQSCSLKHFFVSDKLRVLTTVPINYKEKRILKLKFFN